VDKSDMLHRINKESFFDIIVEQTKD